MALWNVLCDNGYRFDYDKQVEADTVRQARDIAIASFGGDHRSRRPFRVTRVPFQEGASLTKSEARLLREVDKAPDKVVDWSSLRQVAMRTLTSRGARLIVGRLLDRSLLTRSDGGVELTYSGILALRERG